MSLKQKFAFLKLLPLVNGLQVQGLDSLAKVDPLTVAAALNLSPSQGDTIAAALKVIGEASNAGPITLAQLAANPELHTLFELVVSNESGKAQPAQPRIECPFCENVFVPERSMLRPINT